MLANGNTMKKTYFWTVLAGLTYAGSSFVMSLTVTSLLGLSAYGILSAAMMIGNQLLTIGYYNVRTFQASDVKEKYSFGDYASLRILTTGVMLIGGAVWMMAEGYALAKTAAVALMILFKAGESVSDLLEGRYQQKERYDVACRGVFVKTALYLTGFIISMAVTRNLLLALAVLAVIYWFLVIIIDSRLLPRFGGWKIRFHWKTQLELLGTCLPLFVNSFLTTYILNASKYAVDKYYNDELLGVFNWLYMMAFVVNLFASFVLKPMITPLSIRYVQGDRTGFVKIIKRQLLIIAGLAVLCVGGAWFLGIPVLSWLSGKDLSDYRIALCIILVGGAFTAVYQLLQYSIIIMRHQFSCLVGCIITAVLTMVVTPLLTSRYAISGAALSYLLSMVVMSAIFLFFVIYYLKGESVKRR